jgi:hypothetical protein
MDLSGRKIFFPMTITTGRGDGMLASFANFFTVLRRLRLGLSLLNGKPFVDSSDKFTLLSALGFEIGAEAFAVFFQRSYFMPQALNLSLKDPFLGIVLLEFTGDHAGVGIDHVIVLSSIKFTT